MSPSERTLLPQRHHRAREIALQLLYALDVHPPKKPEKILDLFPLEQEDPEVMDYTRKLVLGFVAHEEEIDRLLRTHLEGWRPERMVIVDRAAVRLALYEGIIAKLVPLPVAISEAVELAKVFGTEESGKFVNGVLGKIVRSLKAKSHDDGIDIEEPPTSPDR